jgi:hypothetical protein
LAPLKGVECAEPAARGFAQFQDIRVGAAMDALQQVWHWVNLLLSPAALAFIHVAICKLLWRRELAAVGMGQLTAWCTLAALVAGLAGFAWTGHDGAMQTYGAIVAALAVTTWLVAFRSARRTG